MPSSSWRRSSLSIARQPERDRQQPGRLRREIEPGGVGAAHDARRAAARPDREIPNSVEQRVEAAELAAMANNARPRRRKGCAELLGHVPHPGRRDEVEYRSGSMKRRISQGQAMRSIFGRSRVTQMLGFASQTSTPGSLDAPPDGRRPRRRLRCRRQACCRHALCRKQRRRELADIVAVSAIDDHRPAGRQSATQSAARWSRQIAPAMRVGATGRPPRGARRR